MDEWHSEEETKAKCIERMGKSLGEVFHELWAEIAWLSYKLNQYTELYSEQKRVDILNATSPDFFRAIQIILGNDILLHIARLTDRRSKDTLTIEKLHRLVDGAIKKDIGRRIATAKQSSEFAHVWRNKRIAHLHFSTAINKNDNSLPPSSIKKIREAISSMSEAMNVVAIHYMSATYAFDPRSRAPMDLLCILHDGLKAQAEREERIRRREYKVADYEPPDL